MARYREYEEEGGHGKTLLIAAGVLVGVLAGAAVAQRLGGVRGIRRRLSRGRGPMFDFLRDTLSPDLFARLARGGDGVLEMLLPSAGRKRRRSASLYDAMLDEYEVEDYERAAAGVDEDEVDAPDAPRGRASVELDEDFDEDDLDDDGDEFDEENAADPQEIEMEVLDRLRRNRALRHRAIEIACDDDGVVSLSGVVRSEREQRAALRLARGVEGVSRVDDALEVREPQAT